MSMKRMQPCALNVHIVNLGQVQVQHAITVQRVGNYEGTNHPILRELRMSEFEGTEF